MSNGAKHSPGHQIGQSEGPPVAVAETVFHQVSYGAKHSLPGDMFQKSGGPPVAEGGPSEIQTSEVKSYPNEAFSIPIKLIFNVDGAKHSPPGNKFEKSGSSSKKAKTRESRFEKSNYIQMKHSRELSS